MHFVLAVCLSVYGFYIDDLDDLKLNSHLNETTSKTIKKSIA